MGDALRESAGYVWEIMYLAKEEAKVVEALVDSIKPVFASGLSLLMHSMHERLFDATMKQKKDVGRQ